MRFHGVPREWIQRQADALDLDLVQLGVGEEGFEAAFREGLERLTGLGIETLIFGNIHLADVRAWYESRTLGAGFEHVEPLWGGEPDDLVREFLELGYRTIVVSVNLELGDAEWLGREIDEELLRSITAEPDRDPCGERGEYHSFVVDGPRFGHPLEPELGAERELEGHRFLEFR